MNFEKYHIFGFVCIISIYTFVFKSYHTKGARFTIEKSTILFEDSKYSRKLSNIAPMMRGIIMCSSEALYGDTLDVITQIREFWNSSLPISIVHCSELSQQTIKIFSEISAVIVQDICHERMNGFSSMHEQKKRLRGFFCKTAAIIHSPFNETLIIDTDTIWFKNPDLLFDAPRYKRTGALFFRDRMITEKPYRLFTPVKRLIEKETNIQITPSVGKDLSQKNGISYFWLHAANPRTPSLGHVQDSSAIVIDITRHKETVNVLEKLLSTFSIGYGDKEIYWIAATIAYKPFAWEPYLFGSYGDCGAVIHYDPRISRFNKNRTDSMETLPTPFFYEC